MLSLSNVRWSSLLMLRWVFVSNVWCWMYHEVLEREEIWRNQDINQTHGNTFFSWSSKNLKVGIISSSGAQYEEHFIHYLIFLLSEEYIFIANLEWHIWQIFSYTLLRIDSHEILSLSLYTKIWYVPVKMKHSALKTAYSLNKKLYFPTKQTCWVGRMKFKCNFC